MQSITCETAKNREDHTMCMRRSCSCFCGHPHWLPLDERDRIAREYRRPQPTPRARIVLPAEEITAAYNAGDGLEALARRYGCGIDTVRRNLAELGVPIRGRGRPKKVAS